MNASIHKARKSAYPYEITMNREKSIGNQSKHPVLVWVHVSLRQIVAGENRENHNLTIYKMHNYASICIGILYASMSGQCELFPFSCSRRFTCEIEEDPRATNETIHDFAGHQLDRLKRGQFTADEEELASVGMSCPGMAALPVMKSEVMKGRRTMDHWYELISNEGSRSKWTGISTTGI